RQGARAAIAARPRRLGTRLAATACATHRQAPRHHSQRQFRAAVAPRHGRHRARRRRSARGHRLARPARSVRPQARSDRDRLCRRDRRRRFHRAGSGRRGDADRRRARPLLDRARRARRGDRAAARARSLPMIDRNASGPVLALSGGVGGAKLALGLYRILPPDTLTVVANTGDDFAHLGLQISPDLDTLLYTLSGNDNPELGWGRRGETWTFMAALEALGGEAWFLLGDGDLATHIERTRRLAAGEKLSPIIGGQAVTGPTATMMAELGLPVDATTVARHYRDFLDLYIADEEDAAAVADLDIPVVLARTLMQSLADREALARAVLAAADR